MTTVGIFANFQAHGTTTGGFHINISNPIAPFDTAAAVNTTDDALPRGCFGPTTRGHPILIVNDVNAVDYSILVALGPTPPSQINGPSQRKLPNDNIFVQGSRIPWLDSIIDDSHKGITNGTVFASIDAILTHLPGNSLDKGYFGTICTRSRTIGKIGIGTIVHIGFLAMGLTKLIRWIGILQFTSFKDVVLIVGGEWCPIGIDIQSIAKFRTISVRIDQGETIDVDILSQDMNILTRTVISFSGYIIFDRRIMIVQDAITANRHIVDFARSLYHSRSHIRILFKVNGRIVEYLKDNILSPIVSYACSKAIGLVWTQCSQICVGRDQFCIRRKCQRRVDKERQGIKLSCQIIISPDGTRCKLHRKLARPREIEGCCSTGNHWCSPGIGQTARSYKEVSSSLIVRVRGDLHPENLVGGQD
mmetsp:Transcript_14822/g.22647  ORF Transcript_14822/g.22647 Transcript_14822/m.22647 type:complete len:419 (-) Transcript_14822:193-1449(-)